MDGDECPSLLWNISETLVISTTAKKVGTHVTFRCTEDFLELIGSGVLVCGEDGTWNDTRPTCSKLQGSPPTTPGLFSTTEYLFIYPSRTLLLTLWIVAAFSLVAFVFLLVRICAKYCVQDSGVSRTDSIFCIDERDLPRFENRRRSMNSPEPVWYWMLDDDGVIRPLQNSADGDVG